MDKCSYFDDLEEESEYYWLPVTEDGLYADGGGRAEPFVAAQQRYYAELLAQGFRRSGAYVYRNTCPRCRQCVPIRIRAERFSFTRRQRALLRKNADLELRMTGEPEELCSPEKVRLMQKYDKRHNPDMEQSYDETLHALWYLNGTIDHTDHFSFSYSGWLRYSGTVNIDYYLGGRLVACSVLDRARDALSSNYFYYAVSPDMLRRSLGTYSILKEIELCQKEGITFYYLGYWIEKCRKMSYKANFKPHELLIDGAWREVAE